MSKRQDQTNPTVDEMLDGAIGELLSQGWDEAPSVLTPGEPEPIVALVPAQEYPPLPVREAQEVVLPEPAERGVMDVGLLADLASGRKSAVEAAAAAGVTEGELQSSLAVALRLVPSEEIAKALGLQAAEQQLKSGAIYGAVLADLVADMAAGRLKPETKIELAKLLARVGRVEPKDDKGVGAGAGFILNINLGAGQQPLIIDAN